MNYYTYLTSMQKYLNRIIDLNIKAKSIYHLEEEDIKYLHDLEIGKDFLERMQKRTKLIN